MGLGTKVMGGYILLLCITLAVSLWAISVFSNLSAAFTAATTENYRSVMAANNMAQALDRQESATTLLLLRGDETAVAEYSDARDSFIQWFDLEKSNITVANEADLVMAVANDYEQFDVYFNQVLALARANQREAATALYQDKVVPLLSGLKQSLHHIVAINDTVFMEGNSRARASAIHAARLTLTVAFASGALALFLGYRVSSAIVRPIGVLTRSVRRMGEGHLDEKIELASGDEIGVLANEFNAMSQRVKQYEDSTLGSLMSERRKSEGIVRVIEDGALVLDTDGRVLLWNPAAETIFGVPEAKALSHLMADIVPDTVWNFVRQVLSDDYRNSGKPPTVPIGKRFYQIETVVLDGPDGHLSGHVVLFKDVTLFHRLDEMKSEFVSTAAHELRTPMTTITMGLGMLKERHLGADPKAIEILDAVEEESQRLTRLVNQLLTLTRLEADRTEFTFTSANLERILADAVGGFAVQAGERHIDLSLLIEPALPPVSADGDKIRSVVNNLISNALRYTPAGGSIKVGAVQRPGAVEVFAADTGLGIPAEDQKRVFEKFYQVRGRTPGGAGLGLSIAKEIIDRHGGRIWVESREGEGSTFRFVLPLADRSDVTATYIGEESTE